MPTIILAEDHSRTREVLRRILSVEADFAIVGEAEDGLQAARLACELQPEVLVCDLMMPGLNGLDLIQRVAQECPKTAVLVVSNYTEQPYVRQALKNGALGYVDKLDCSGHLAKAVRVALTGERYLSPSLSCG